ncbi:integumentary mucin C.1-like isoform X2 [Orbicella faveolata]|uniref:integumentary mucin C.1-like isoform X2 n=1 Tax=Orbicella faveolata TaxID=48498 RepID=UPI0009E3C380|nr:integumentary mucin C.1-like isoform X2 [Orbicella faveolata]
MACIDKIILMFVVVQVTLVLAKPHEPEYDERLYHSSDDMEKFVYRRGDSCAVAPEKRKNCGYGGITAQECESKGCCFDDSIRGVIWCFEKGDCGSGCELEGCYSRRCRSSCRNNERPVSIFDRKCSGGDKCCMCHVAWGNGCTYDP